MKTLVLTESELLLLQSFVADNEDLFTTGTDDRDILGINAEVVYESLFNKMEVLL